MPIPTVTLRGDLTSNFGVAPTWTDYTAWLELGRDGQPIDITWGRRDKDSQVQVTTFSFILDNTDGRFTVGASIVETKARFNVRVTVGGNTYDRATGYVESVETTWPGKAANYAQVRVNCVDVSQRLADAQPLRSLYEYAVLADNPGAFYPCTESSGLSVGNIATTIRPSGQIVTTKFGAEAYQLGDEPLIYDEATSFGASWSQNPGDKKGAAIRIPYNALGSTFTAEMVFACRQVNQAVSQCLFALTDPEGQSNRLGVFVVPGFAYATFSSDQGSTPTASGNGNWQDGAPHHLVVTMSGPTPTLSIWIDGVMIGSAAAPGGHTVTRFASSYPLFGMPTLNPVFESYALNGRIGMLALYPGVVLNSSQIANHFAAYTGQQGERSDQRFSRIAALGGITTSGLPVGQALMGPQIVSGRPAVDVLREVARTENGPLLVTGAGDLTFQSRLARYNPVAAFSVAASEIDPNIVVRKDRDGLVNDQTYQRFRGGQQRHFDQTSITAYGRREGPGGTVAPSTDEDARQHAAWDVATGKDPRIRLSTVSLDLLSQPTTSLVQSILAATVSTPFTVTGLPAQTPGGTSIGLFVEGAHEQIGPTNWSVELFTSPTAAVPATLRADAAPSALTKLDVGIKVGF